MPRAASSAGVGRRKKRATVMASYNILDARYSRDGAILLVGLRNYEAHLSVTFLTAGHVKPCGNVCLLRCDFYGSWHICRYILNYDLASFFGFILHTYFLKALGGLLKGKVARVVWTSSRSSINGHRSGFFCSQSNHSSQKSHLNNWWYTPECYIQKRAQESLITTF